MKPYWEASSAAAEQIEQERLNALIEFDIDYCQAEMPQLPRETIILGMHKARYLCKAVPAELRHASAAWLREGGHTNRGAPILPEGQLP